MNADPSHPIPRCPGGVLSRRDFIRAATASAAAWPVVTGAFTAPKQTGRLSIPRAPTALAFCRSYDYHEVRRTLGTMLDSLDHVRRLVRRKHVAVKVNLVNSSDADLAGVPLWLTVTVHPAVAMALGSLLVEYGARRVTYCEQLPFRTPDEAAFAGYGFRLAEFNEVMRNRARFHNTRNRSPHRDYAIVRVPGGGDLASSWEVNRAYTDTDVLISLGKLKSHVSGGITAGMKNLFGVPPSSLYGDDLKDEPDENAVGYRNRALHDATALPRTSTSTFTGRTIRGEHGHNVPRFIVDLTAAFPIDLVVVDAVSTIQTVEGWWIGSMVSITRPGLLLAGRNPVCTDAIGAAVMGFDPDAPDRQLPFVNGTNYLALARNRGLGENRPRELEVVGLDLATARFAFQPTYRRTAP